MELDELKNTWMVLDEQLKKNEMLNKRIVQEMLYKKSNKSLSWLINMDVLGIILLPLFIPLCIWLYKYSKFHYLLSSRILLVVGMATCILGTIWSCYKVLKYLIKIDFSKSISDNIHYVNSYNILIKKEKIVSYCIVLPVYLALAIFYYYELKVNFSYWTFLIVVFLSLTVVIYWAYKKIYDANIHSIKKSLEELKELKEE